MRTSLLLARLPLAAALIGGCGPSTPEPAPRPTTTHPALPAARPTTTQPDVPPTDVPTTLPPTDAPPPPDDATAAPVEPPAEGVVGLTRRDVDAALADIPALEAHLADAETDPGHGRRLLRVVDVPRGSLLDRLGLRPGDVVTRVNRRWVLRDRPNPLWEALRGRRPVTVLVLRDGAPHTYQYVVD